MLLREKKDSGMIQVSALAGGWMETQIQELRT